MSLNTILATAPLTTTNYVIKATGTALGNSIIFDNGTNVGIGNTNTSFTLDVSGTGRFTGIVTFGSTLSNGTYAYTLPSATGTLALTSAIPANPVGGTGTTNTIPKFTASSTIGDSAITDDGTTVTLVSRALSGTSASFSSTATATAFIPSGATIPSNGMYLSAANTLNFATNTTNRLTITSAGNVGIGTTSATSPLSIYYPSTSAEVNYIKMEMPSWGGSVDFKKNIIWHDSGAIVGAIGMSFASSQTYMDFHSFYNTAHTTTTLMRIQGNGNVVIGSTTANAKLDVASTYVSDTTTQVMFRDNTGGGLLFGGTGGAVKWLQAQDYTGAATYYNLLLNPRGGSIGIGSTTVYNGGGFQKVISFYSPSSLALTYVTDTQQYQVGIASNDYRVYDFTGSTYRFVIKATTGNVVIGDTTDNGNKLQVNGTTNSTNYRTINGSALCPAGGTVTLITLSSSVAGTYIINGNFGAQGLEIYGGMLIVVANGGSFRIVLNGSGTRSTLTLSGANVQITNALGVQLDATANAILIAN